MKSCDDSMPCSHAADGVRCNALLADHQTSSSHITLFRSQAKVDHRSLKIPLFHYEQKV